MSVVTAAALPSVLALPPAPPSAAAAARGGDALPPVFPNPDSPGSQSDSKAGSSSHRKAGRRAGRDGASRSAATNGQRYAGNPGATSPEIMSAPLPETKICSGCGLMLPLLDFDRCKKGLPERRAKCRECRLEVGKKFRDTKRRREAGRLFSEVHRKFVHGEDEGAILFVNAMITRFGGLDAFVRLVRDWMVDARTPASFRCKLALTLIHLIESLALRIEQREQAAAREASERLGAMPGEVLSEELEASALRLLRGRGWTVTRA